jgi:hypothetical protein
MMSLRSVWLAPLAAMACTGCLNPAYTRLPTLSWNPADVELRSYEFHDPLPDRDMAREVERPRGFGTPRAEPRRILERSMSPAPYGSDGAPIRQPPPLGRYSNAVPN